MKTKTKKILGILFIFSFIVNSTFAATQIGTGTVTGSSSLDTPIMWDDKIPGTASGTIDGILITAEILPTLNMVVSADSIDLGILNPSLYRDGFVNIEVGTNAASGLDVTAKSTNGGLLSSNSSILNDTTTTDGIADSYKFASILGATADSDITGYTRTAGLDVEVNDTTTSHTLYHTNKPESLSTSVDDFKFKVSAKPNAQSPAGKDYKDVVILTVVGNF